MNVKLTAVAAAFLFTISASARAQLAWEKTEIELHPPIGEENAVAHFNYENKGKRPIKISSVRPSCGCTVASITKNDVAPGDKGEIVASLKIGDRTGTQLKTLSVETDDPKTPFIMLTMKTVISQAVDMQPSFVYWETGEASKAKTITIKAAKEIELKKVDVASSSPDFTVEVKPAGAGEFRIEVQPRDTARQLAATLTIKPEVTNHAVKPLFASARVASGQAPAPAPAH